MVASGEGEVVASGEGEASCDDFLDHLLNVIRKDVIGNGKARDAQLFLNINATICFVNIKPYITPEHLILQQALIFYSP